MTLGAVEHYVSYEPQNNGKDGLLQEQPPKPGPLPTYTEPENFSDMPELLFSHLRNLYCAV